MNSKLTIIAYIIHALVVIVDNSLKWKKTQSQNEYQFIYCK